MICTYYAGFVYGSYDAERINYMKASTKRKGTNRRQPHEETTEEQQDKGRTRERRRERVGPCRLGRRNRGLAWHGTGTRKESNQATRIVLRLPSFFPCFMCFVCLHSFAPPPPTPSRSGSARAPSLCAYVCVVHRLLLCCRRSHVRVYVYVQCIHPSRKVIIGAASYTSCVQFIWVPTPSF